MSLDQNLNKILIIDFGSQFTQLIARRVRELGVFSEIVSHKKIKLKDINHGIKGIVLSGGPLNVYQINKYSFDKKILQLMVEELEIPVTVDITNVEDSAKVLKSELLDVPHLKGENLSKLVWSKYNWNLERDKLIALYYTLLGNR